MGSYILCDVRERSRIHKRFSVLLVSLLVLGQVSHAQFSESVEKNLAVYKRIRSCAEGYAGDAQGRTISYPRLDVARPEALVTRASTGTMVIEWKSRPAPSSGGTVTFVVMAGIYSQSPAGYKFQMSVNGVSRFDFATVTADSWAVRSAEGGELAFIGTTRDPFGDVFGYLLINLPSGWVKGGEAVSFSVRGEKAGSGAWFMVFTIPDVIASLAKRIAAESYFRLSVRQQGAVPVATFRGTSAWIGRKLSSSAPGLRGDGIPLTGDGGTAFASFSCGGNLGPFRLLLDGDPLVEIGRLGDTIDETRLYPARLVTVRSMTGASREWVLEYRSSWAPQIGGSLIELSSTARGSGAQHLIISTHQDIAWMDSPEECVKARDEKIITPLLSLMKQEPEYCFDLEDALILREYLTRHPDRKSEVAGLLGQGRLTVGATFNQPYEDLCSSEMLVRECYAGRKWLRRNFPGVDTRTAWNMDVPARSLQMPQVMEKAGVSYLCMSRFAKGLYRWMSPDGSGVLAFSPGHYGDFALGTVGLPFEGVADYLAKAALDWRKRTLGTTTAIPVVSMMDMSGPENYGGLVREWNSLKSVSDTGSTDTPLSLPRMKYSTAERFLDDVSRENPSLKEVKGERPDLWLYIHGPTHHWAISAKREADRYLPAAEIFSTVKALLEGSFMGYPQDALTRAWEAQIYPDHGWGGKNGEITDSTFRAKYEFARDISKDIYLGATASLAGRIRTDPAGGIPIHVFNDLSWQRSGPVECTVSFPAGVFRRGFTLRGPRADPGGASLPFQVLSARRNPDGSLKSAAIVFIAENVPSIGYTTYYARPSTKPLPVASGTGGAAGVLETKFYKVTLSPGGIREIFDRELGREILGAGKFLGGELFTMQSVGEDAGEWAEPQQPTMEGFEKMSERHPLWRMTESGPVRFVAELHQEFSHTTVYERLIVYRSLRRIDVEVSLLAFDGTKYREFRLAFPVGMPGGEVAYEVPFGALRLGRDEMKGSAGERYIQEVSATRPRGIQDWIGVSGPEYGVTLSSSVSVWDYRDPTDSAAAIPLLQPVLLASRRSCHGEGPWYLQKGDHQYRFSLTSYRGSWHRGMKGGTEAVHPLTAVVGPVKVSGRDLAERGSFLSISSGNVRLSTMKKCEDDTSVVLRIYETAGEGARPEILLPAAAQRAAITNIIEEEERPFPSRGKRLRLEMGCFAIETVKIYPERRGARED